MSITRDGDVVVAREVAAAAVQSTRSVFGRPDVKAALLVSPALLVLGLFEVGTGGFGALLVHPLRTAVYIIQGYVLGKHVRRRADFGEADLIGLGVRSAALGWLISFVWSGLCLVFMGAMTGGLFFATLPLAFAAHVVSILFNVVLTPAAARMTYRHGGKRLLLTLFVFAIVAAITAVVIAGTLIALLVWLGASILSSWWR